MLESRHEHLLPGYLGMLKCTQGRNVREFLNDHQYLLSVAATQILDSVNTIELERNYQP
jgi:hypothetical protein